MFSYLTNDLVDAAIRVITETCWNDRIEYPEAEE